MLFIGRLLRLLSGGEKALLSKDSDGTRSPSPVSRQVRQRLSMDRGLIPDQISVMFRPIKPLTTVTGREREGNIRVSNREAIEGM